MNKHPPPPPKAFPPLFGIYVAFQDFFWHFNCIHCLKWQKKQTEVNKPLDLQITISGGRSETLSPAAGGCSRPLRVVCAQPSIRITPLRVERVPSDASINTWAQVQLLLPRWPCWLHIVHMFQKKNLYPVVWTSNCIINGLAAGQTHTCFWFMRMKHKFIMTITFQGTKPKKMLTFAAGTGCIWGNNSQGKEEGGIYSTYLLPIHRLDYTNSTLATALMAT